MRAPVGVQSPAAGGVPSAGRLDAGGPRVGVQSPADQRRAGRAALPRGGGNGAGPAAGRRVFRSKNGANAERSACTGERAGGEGPAPQELQPGGGAGVAGTSTRRADGVSAQHADRAGRRRGLGDLRRPQGRDAPQGFGDAWESGTAGSGDARTPRRSFASAATRGPRVGASPRASSPGAARAVSRPTGRRRGRGPAGPTPTRTR